MEPISLFFLALSGAYAVLGYRFLSRFTGRKAKNIFFTIAVCAEIFLASVLPLSEQYLSLLMAFAVPFLLGRALLKIPWILSAAASALMVVVICMINGIANSTVFLLNDMVSPDAWGGISVLVGLLTVPALWFTYRCIERYVPAQGAATGPGAAILVLPLVFILVVVQFISVELYGNVVVLDDFGQMLLPNVNNWAMLLVQLAGFGCLGAVLFAFRKFSQGARMETQIGMLEQQMRAQKEYMREAQGRYDGTRAFRHDMKNHFLVLEGLLRTGETEKACMYLENMEQYSDTLFSVFRTGNTVIDVLFASKLGAAEQAGVSVECKVKIPDRCPIPEIDLCVIFSNAIDNAMKACADLPVPARKLCIDGREQGDFFFIEAENSAGPEERYEKGEGIGLSNIRMIAEKHYGTMETEYDGGSFRLSVLLQRVN